MGGLLFSKSESTSPLASIKQKRVCEVFLRSDPLHREREPFVKIDFGAPSSPQDLRHVGYPSSKVMRIGFHMSRSERFCTAGQLPDPLCQFHDGGFYSVSNVEICILHSDKHL